MGKHAWLLEEQHRHFMSGWMVGGPQYQLFTADLSIKTLWQHVSQINVEQIEDGWQWQYTIAHTVTQKTVPMFAAFDFLPLYLHN